MINSVYHSKLLGRHIDLAGILSISDARFDHVSSGPWCTQFEVIFQLSDKPLVARYELNKGERELRFTDASDPIPRNCRHLAVLRNNTTIWLPENRFSEIGSLDQIVAVMNLQTRIDVLLNAWKAFKVGEQ